jgi:hypothetical protein
MGALSKGIAAAMKEALAEYPDVLTEEDLNMYAKYMESSTMRGIKDATQAKDQMSNMMNMGMGDMMGQMQGGNMNMGTMGGMNMGTMGGMNMGGMSSSDQGMYMGNM